MPSRPFRVLAISGSLRKGSVNTGLVRLAMRIAPRELEFELIDWIDQLPWMNPDLETDPPEILQRWWQALRDADGLLVGMPEYNWNPTPLAKNALDWATRPPEARAIAGKVVAFIGAGGRGGTAKAQDGIGMILGYMGAVMVDEPKVQLAQVADRFDPQGDTDDPEVMAAVAAKLTAMLASLRAQHTPPAP